MMGLFLEDEDAVNVDRSRARVLVIEDERSMADLLRQGLRINTTVSLSPTPGSTA